MSLSLPQRKGAGARPAGRKELRFLSLLISSEAVTPYLPAPQPGYHDPAHTHFSGSFSLKKWALGWVVCIHVDVWAETPLGCLSHCFF